MAKKAVKSAPKAKVAETAALVPVIKKGAMSVDVGPAVIAGFSKALQDEAAANAVLQQVDAKRYDLLGKLTAGIIKAAKADSSIDLSTAFVKDPKAQGRLNDQLGIALGFREVQTINPGTDKEAQRVAWSKEVAAYVLTTSAEKDTPEGKRKSTVRSNFMHALKKCCQAALGIMDSKIDAKMDDKAGTLRLSGPAVKTVFGAPVVHLDEKQTVGDKKLSQKPSFTAMAALAGEKRGVEVNRKSNTRGRSKVLANPTEALRDVAKSFKSMIGALGGKVSDAQREILEEVRTVLDKALD